MARNFTRSSSGCDGVERLVEHALVELEPAQLAVDVERGILEIRRIKIGRRHDTQHRLRRRLRRWLSLGTVPPFSHGGVAGGNP